MILLTLLIFSEGFEPAQAALIEATTHRFERWLPEGIELTFYHSDVPGAYATCGVGDRADNCSISLGLMVWSRSEAIRLGYPAYGPDDDTHAKIWIGHELGHLALTPAEEALYAERLGISDADYAKEEAATVLAHILLGIPLGTFEQDGTRRMAMFRWFSAVRRARFAH